MSNLFKYFIPKDFEVTEVHRAKNLLSLLMLTFIASIICWPFQSITKSEFPFFWLSIITIVIIFAFKYTHSLFWLSNFCSLILFCLLAIFSLKSGGALSMDLLAFQLVVLFALATNEIKSVIFWFMASIAWITYVFINYGDPHNLAISRTTMNAFPVYYFYVINLILLIIPTTLMYIIFRLNKQLIAEIKDNNIELNNINSDLKEQKIKLSNSNQKLEESNKRLESFAYAVSHDLKQPLQTITSYSKLLKKKFNADENMSNQNKLFINQIEISSMRMNAQIKEMLSYSIQDGEQLHKLSDLNIILETVQKDLKVLMAQHEIKLMSQKLPSINIVPGTLYPVFQNLISNAIKYKKPNAPLRIDIKWKEFDQHYEFCFSDNGIGINEENKASIFELFKQLDDSREGSGIGLYTCKQIIESYGGKIWVESEIAKGSSFYFTILKNSLRNS